MEEQVTDITPQGEKANESPEYDIAPLEDRYNLSIQLELELVDISGSGDILAHEKESKTQTKKKLSQRKFKTIRNKLEIHRFT